MAKRKKKKSRRKTYRLKRTAKSAARGKGKSVYKVKGGWRVSRKRGKRRRKYPLRRRRAARKGIVLTRTVAGRKPRRMKYYKR